MSKMNLWFLKQGFLENMVVQEPGKVKLSKSPQRTSKRNKGVCLIAIYHLLLQNIGRIFQTP